MENHMSTLDNHIHTYKLIWSPYIVEPQKPTYTCNVEVTHWPPQNTLWSPHGKGFKNPCATKYNNLKIGVDNDI